MNRISAGVGCSWLQALGMRGYRAPAARGVVRHATTDGLAPSERTTKSPGVWRCWDGRGPRRAQRITRIAREAKINCEKFLKTKFVGSVTFLIFARAKKKLAMIRDMFVTNY